MKKERAIKENSFPVTGTHILVEAITDNSESLLEYEKTQIFLERKLEDLGITKLGSIYHDFPEGGFTCLLGLAESHISIHTWPDIYFLTMDIYLCNYTKNNEHSARKLNSELLNYFKPKYINKRVIYR